MSAPTKTATKQAARKSVPSKSLPCPFKSAIDKGDHGGAINILLAKLDESNHQISDLVADIKAKQHTINSFTGLISLAHAMGKL